MLNLDIPEQFSEIRWEFLQIITPEECLNFREPDGTTMCTLGTDHNVDQAPCGLNDGTALAYFSNSSWIQVGIGSWPSCSSNYPGIFTRVSVYLSWVSAVTGITNWFIIKRK